MSHIQWKSLTMCKEPKNHAISWLLVEAQLFLPSMNKSVDKKTWVTPGTIFTVRTQKTFWTTGFGEIAWNRLTLALLTVNEYTPVYEQSILFSDLFSEGFTHSRISQYLTHWISGLGLINALNQLLKKYVKGRNEPQGFLNQHNTAWQCIQITRNEHY